MKEMNTDGWIETIVPPHMLVISVIAQWVCLIAGLVLGGRETTEGSVLLLIAMVISGMNVGLFIANDIKRWSGK